MDGKTVALVLLAFGITFLEEAIATRRTQATTARRPVAGANWSALFEFTLLVDVWFLMTDYWLAIPIVLGAWIGAYTSIRRTPQCSQPLD